MKTSLTLAATILVASTLSAQNKCVYIPDNNAAAGACNVIPFGTQKTSSTWRNQKYQTLILASKISKSPIQICELGFASCGTGVRSFDSIEIKMGYTKSSALSKTFATNLASRVQTVLSAKNYSWHNTANKWNRIGLQKSFLFIPQFGNLVIQITLRGSDFPSRTGQGFHRATQPRLYSIGWGTNPPATGSLGNGAVKIELCFDKADYSLFGIGCKGSNGLVPSLTATGLPQLGKTVQINLANAPTPVSPAVLILSTSNATPLPADLTGAGAPGCFLYVRPDFLLGLAATNGKASVKLPIPNSPSLLCARFYNQFLVVDPKANKLKLTTSNYGRGLIGN